MSGKGIRNKIRGRENAPPSPSDTEAYKEWAGKKRNKVSAKMRGISRYAFGGATEEETEKWSKGRTRKWARRITRGAAIGGNLGKRAIRKGGAMIDEDTSKEITDKAAKLKGKNLATIQVAFDNAVTNTGRISAISAAQEGGLLDHMNIPDKEKVIKGAWKSSPGDMYKVKNLDPTITAKVVRENPMSRKITKTAGMFVKEEDKEKYGNILSEEDDRITSMKPEDREKTLIKDKEGNAKLNSNSERQYNIKEESRFKDADGNFVDILEAKIIASIKAAQMNTIDEETALKIADTEVLHEFWEGAQVSKAAELFGASFIEKFRKQMNAPGRGEKWYEEKNKPLYNFLRSTGAQRIGLGFAKTSGGATDGQTTMDRLLKKHDELNERLIALDNDTRKAPSIKRIERQDIKNQIKNIKEEIKTENETQKPAPPPPKKIPKEQVKSKKEKRREARATRKENKKSLKEKYGKQGPESTKDI